MQATAEAKLTVIRSVSIIEFYRTCQITDRVREVICFHSPPNSDMGYKIFNVRIRSFCMRLHKRDLVYRLIRRTFCRVFQCCVFSE